MNTAKSIDRSMIVQTPACVANLEEDHQINVTFWNDGHRWFVEGPGALFTTTGVGMSLPAACENFRINLVRFAS